MQLSQKIKNLRERENLSQSDFGKKIGVKTNTVWRWESGQATPQTKILQRICDVFNITLSSLIDNTSEIIDNPLQKNEDFSIKVGTETMTFKNGEQEFTVPYDRELSLQILRSMFGGKDNISIINGNNNSNNRMNS